MVRFVKKIQVGVDIKDPIGVATDENNLLEILRNRFEGKCYNKCFIEKITKIVRMGECVIEQTGHPTLGTIPVIFLAEVIEYGAGEIINNCVVQQVNNEMIVCSTNTAAILIKFHPMFKSIRTGQIISVRVGRAQYRINTEKISVSAVPFVPGTGCGVYKITEGDFITESVKKMLEEIAAEEKRLAAMAKNDTKLYESFKKLLYARDTDAMPKGCTVIDLKKIVSRGVEKYVGKFITRHFLQDLSLYKAVIMNEADDLPGGVYQHVEIDAVMFEILNDYYSYIKTLGDYIEIYSSPKILEDHKNLWLIYKKNQKSGAEPEK